MPKFTLFQTRRPATTPEEALAITSFWRDAGPKMWFAKDPEFEELFHIRFQATYEAAVAGKLSDWNDTPEGSLALAILLDQFPRTSLRGTPHTYNQRASATAGIVHRFLKSMSLSD